MKNIQKNYYNLRLSADISPARRSNLLIWRIFFLRLFFSLKNLYVFFLDFRYLALFSYPATISDFYLFLSCYKKDG